MKKCQDIFNPPGIVHITETAFKKQSNIHPDVKMAVPQDSIFKRQKMEQKLILSAAADAKNLPPALNDQKKSTVSTIKKLGTKQTDSSLQDKERLSTLFKEYQLDLQLERENANNVNFEQCFQDNLPTEVQDLDTFLRSFKEKDSSHAYNFDNSYKKA